MADYTPQYLISDRLLNYLVKLETSKALLEQADVPSGIKGSFKNEAKAFALFHLAHMLGINITIKEAGKLAEGRKLGIEGVRMKLVNNFRSVLEFNRSNVAESYSELDITLMLHLNKILLNNWKEPWDVKIRTTGEQPSLDLEDWGGVQNLDQHADVGTELNDLIHWFKISATRVHPVIRLAVLVQRMAEIAPFLAGNKYTIIAIADFFLTRWGYTEKTFSPVTRVFDVYSDELIEAWDISRQKFDISLWIEKFVKGLAKDVEEQKTELDKQLAEEQEKNSKQPFLDLNKRQLKILKYLQTIPTVKREDYCAMMDVSTMTAYRDLDDLVSKKLIRVDGRGRGTKYMLVSR